MSAHVTVPPAPISSITSTFTTVTGLPSGSTYLQISIMMIALCILVVVVVAMVLIIIVTGVVHGSHSSLDISKHLM